MKKKEKIIDCHFRLSKIEGLALANYKCKGFFLEVVFDNEDLVSETTVDSSKQVVDFKGEFATFQVDVSDYPKELVILTIKALLKKDTSVDIATLEFPLRCIPMNARLSQKFVFQNKEIYSQKIKAVVEAHVCEHKKYAPFDGPKGKLNVEILTQFMAEKGTDVTQTTKKAPPPPPPSETQRRSTDTINPKMLNKQQPQQQTRPHPAPQGPVDLDIPSELLEAAETAIAMAPPEVWRAMANPQFIREALTYYRVRLA